MLFDFPCVNDKNFDKFMKAHDEAENYVRSLGGDYAGFKCWFGVRIRALDQSDAKITK